MCFDVMNDESPSDLKQTKNNMIMCFFEKGCYALFMHYVYIMKACFVDECIWITELVNCFSVPILVGQIYCQSGVQVRRIK
jgi:hypothetical protein